MQNFEVRGAVPVGRVACPLARLLRSAARRERLILAVVRDVHAGLRGPDLVARIDLLLSEVLKWQHRK